MDEKLPWWESISLKMHLFLCRGCASFTRQLHFLHKAAHQSRANPEFRLTDEARQRITTALKDRHGDREFR